MSRRDKQKNEFWIVNVSKKNVTLSDLALSIPSGRSMNLLDNRHHHYTLEQIQQSAEKGSIYRKRDKIKIRKQAPQKIIEPGLQLAILPAVTSHIQGLPSLVTIEEKRYEELDISDEKFAEEFADLEIDK